MVKNEWTKIKRYRTNVSITWPLSFRPLKVSVKASEGPSSSRTQNKGTDMTLRPTPAPHNTKCCPSVKHVYDTKLSLSMLSCLYPSLLFLPGAQRHPAATVAPWEHVTWPRPHFPALARFVFALLSTGSSTRALWTCPLLLVHPLHMDLFSAGL